MGMIQMTKMLRHKQNAVVIIVALGGAVFGAYRSIWSFFICGACVLVGKFALSKFFEEKK